MGPGTRVTVPALEISARLMLSATERTATTAFPYNAGGDVTEKCAGGGRSVRMATAVLQAPPSVTIVSVLSSEQ